MENDGFFSRDLCVHLIPFPSPGSLVPSIILASVNASLFCSENNAPKPTRFNLRNQVTNFRIAKINTNKIIFKRWFKCNSNAVTDP